MRLSKCWLFILITASILLLSDCFLFESYINGVDYYAACWSPDGERIYYFKNVWKDKKYLKGESYSYKTIKDEWYICSCDTNGENEKVIYFLGDVIKGALRPLMSLDISLSGEIVYSTEAGIWIVDTNGLHNRQILTYGEKPRFAFNYQKIIFEYDSAIFLMNKNGEEVKKIIERGCNPSFADITNKLLYNLSPKGYSMIYCYSLGDSTIDSLTKGTDFDFNPSGNKFAFKYLGNMYIYDLDDSTKQFIVDLYFETLRWAPSDKIVISDLSIWVVNPSNKNVKEILIHRRW